MLLNRLIRKIWKRFFIYSSNTYITLIIEFIKTKLCIIYSKKILRSSLRLTTLCLLFTQKTENLSLWLNSFISLYPWVKSFKILSINPSKLKLELNGLRLCNINIQSNNKRTRTRTRRSGQRSRTINTSKLARVH